MKSLLLPFQDVSFSHPWVFFLVPVTILLALLMQREQQRPATPSSALLGAIHPGLRAILAQSIVPVLAAGALICLSLAAARPQLKTVLNREEARRNIMLTIDVSRSMEARDLLGGGGWSSRIEATKQVVKDFIEHRPADRIGLVVFGQTAFLQSPLTSDHDLILEMLKDLEAGMAGDGTAIGDGLGVSLKRLRDIPGNSKTIILITDGVSNSGSVHPLSAAGIAQKLGITVHTIGIGSSGGSLGGFLGGMQADFDPETLKKIAKLTGGTYNHATNVSGLESIYKQIDSLETTVEQDSPRTITEELFYPSLLAGVAFLLLSIFSSSVLLRRTA